MDNKIQNQNVMIQVKRNTWIRLKNRKAYPSQTFDTIINNALDYEVSSMPYKYNNLNSEDKKDENNKMANLENKKQNSRLNQTIQNNLKGEEGVENPENSLPAISNLNQTGGKTNGR